MNTVSHIVLFVIILFCASCKQNEDSPKEISSDTTQVVNPIDSAKTYHEKAYYIYNLINKYYSVPGTNFLLENYPVEAGDNPVSYMWSYSGAVRGVGILRQFGYKDTTFNKIDRGIDQYWSNNNNLAGVDSYPPVYGGGTRFYDDNATIGLDYLQNYQATQNQHYLDQAIKCMNFDFTGESTAAGGGLYWDENDTLPGTTNYLKAGCSSAFATTLALKLYQITNEKKYLDFATRVYNWMKLTLQDPTDLIYWNDIAITTGTIDVTKWTYISGAMLSNAVLLYQITGNQQYLTDAEQLAPATFSYFTVSSDLVEFQFPNHDPWFTTILFRGYLDFFEIDPTKNTKYIDAMIKNVDYAWLHARTDLGFFYEDWSGGQMGRYQWLLDQACMIEIYGRIAIYKDEKL
jgi:predicted alpha-1,6-mannanase (GH76 family)